MIVLVTCTEKIQHSQLINSVRMSNVDRTETITLAGNLITLTPLLHEVRGLGKWASAIAPSARLKARKKSPSGEKSLLSKPGPPSGLRESAAVHHAQERCLDFGDENKMGDDDSAVVRTVERLTVTGSDDPENRQEEEAKSCGGIPSL